MLRICILGAIRGCVNDLSYHYLPRIPHTFLVIPEVIVGCFMRYVLKCAENVVHSYIRFFRSWFLFKDLGVVCPLKHKIKKKYQAGRNDVGFTETKIYELKQKFFGKVKSNQN